MLVRKNVFEKLGGWDSVRVAGDTEFLRRLEKVFGEESVIRVEASIPFSIALSNESSLTETKMTHVRTIYFGLRRTYREAFEWWHNQVETAEELYMDPKKVNRPFPSPVPNLISKPHSRKYDTILIADFSTESDLNTLITNLEDLAGKNEPLAIFHWPDYKKSPDNRIATDIYHLVNQQQIDLLVPNEVVEARNLFFLTPKVLDYALDHVPKIKCNQAWLVHDDTFTAKSKLRKEKNLEKVMQIKGKWCTNQDLKYK